MNYGTIGTGWITNSFIKAAKETGKLTLRAVYSRSMQKAKEFSDSHDAQHVFTDLEQMAKSKEIEVVYIASPNSLHYEQAVMFLKHRIHVICEKPIFSNTKELNGAYKIAEENGVYLFEAVRNIHSPNFRRLKEKVKKIGNVRSTILHRLQYSSRYDRFLNGEKPNVFTSDYSGGSLVDLGVYPLYLAAALFGEPQRISYFPVILRTGVDGNGTLILQYANFICTIVCSKISHSSIPCEIHGEEATIVFDNVAPITSLDLIDSHSKERTSFDTQQHDQDMVYEIESITRIIETGNDQEYKELKSLSQLVLSITETAREQNGIVFRTEKLRFVE